MDTYDIKKMFNLLKKQKGSLEDKLKKVQFRIMEIVFLRIYTDFRPQRGEYDALVSLEEMIKEEISKKSKK